MKKTAFLVLGLFAFVACSSNKENTSEENSSEVAESIGGDKDENGCLTAAGESWSALKQSCVQVFTVGVRLNPIETKAGDAVISAFVVYNDDKSKVELFLADNAKSTTILEKSSENTYQNSTYNFDAKESALYINGEKKYSAQ